MVKRTRSTSAASEEERFLLRGLRRLHNSDQRYLFTLMADLLSIGLASVNRGRKRPARN